MSFQALELGPHAASVLGAALPPRGTPSHAYLLHGPAGSGKRAAARAFAAALLADGCADPERVLGRVERGVHPDLTWVRPSGAAEMLVRDIDEPVVAAATRTPFEARRRVFVIEGADLLGERAANRLLKTLEEPADFVCLLLLATRLPDVLATIVSRCQLVRFDPASPERIAERLRGQAGPEGGDLSEPLAAACARLGLGDELRARRLAGADGMSLRSAAEQLADALLSDAPLGSSRPWEPVLDAAKQAGEQAASAGSAALQEELESLPAAERRRREREVSDAARRASRRERTQALDLALGLLELWLRDLLCVLEGVPEAVLAVDRAPRLAAAAERLSCGPLHESVALVGETRIRLRQNVSEELAVEALAHRVRALLGTRADSGS